MDRNALDWLFSTAPQALAALVGLFFTGITFFNSFLEKKKERDETSEDFYDEMKRDIHVKMKTLFWLAGIAIILDLVLIVLNPIEEGKRFSFWGSFDFYLLCGALVFLLNIFAMTYAFVIVVRILRPSFFKDTVRVLSEKVQSGTVKAMDFFEEFRNFESALKSLPLNYLDLPMNKGGRYQQSPTIKEIISRLGLFQVVNQHDVDRMLQLNHLRNLIAHNSDIKNVEKAALEDVKTYTKKIIEIKGKIDSSSKE